MTTVAAAVAAARREAREFGQVAAELELLSHGRTMAVDGRVTGSKDHSPILHVDEEPYPHEHYRRRWDAASSAPERAVVLARARAALDAARRSPPPPEQLLERGSYHWKVRIGTDTVTPIAELARLYDVTRRTVRAYRKQYGTNAGGAPVRRAELRSAGDAG